MTNPITHVKDSYELEGKAFVHLYTLQMFGGGYMFMSDSGTVSWQGITWESWPLKFSGVGKSGNEETHRPVLQVANFTFDVDGEPIKGVFSALNAANKLEGASLIRKRIHKDDIEEDNNIFTQTTWRVSRVTAITPDVIGMEMRNSLDVPRFTIPARQFIPPDFPQVSLY